MTMQTLSRRLHANSVDVAMVRFLGHGSRPGRSIPPAPFPHNLILITHSWLAADGDCVRDWYRI